MGPSVQFDDQTLESFDERVRGTVLQPGDDGYDEARSVWNAMINKEPAVIVRCTGTADVMAAVEFASEQGLKLAVKGGGHNIAGHAVCDDGLVIDLVPMNGVRVDPHAMTVRVQGGATWGDLNHETWAFGLETVGMPYPEVGVGGFTLGGGMAHLSRKHGLAIDNLRAVDVVTAEGELVHASEDEHPDLFWALRGGSGNYGVVTSFEFNCHEETLEALSGLFLHPIEAAKDVLRFYREYMADAPEEVVAAAGLIHLPESSEFPDEYLGETITMLSGHYMGDVEEGRRALQPLQEFGDPLFETVSPQSYSERGDDPLQEGQRNHWKNHYFADITDEAIDTFVEQAVPLPTPLGAHFFSLGGAINRINEKATAYPHRDATHIFEFATQWSDPDDDETFISWARELHEAMAPHATGGEYVNNQTDDGPERVRAAYGDNYDRLVAVKNEWDPENLFRMNQNIEPTI